MMSLIIAIPMPTAITETDRVTVHSANSDIDQVRQRGVDLPGI